MAHEDDVARESEHADTVSADEESVRIRLGVGGIAIAFAGRRAFFERHVAPLMEAMYARAAGSASSVAHPASPASGAAAFQPTAPERFQKFAGQVGANAATVEQRVMAFAFYLWNYERHDDFDGAAIGAFFRTVHETPPEALDALLEDLASTKRWLEPGSGDGRWRLTTKGVNYVKNRLLGTA